jgi:hypothetical protein
MCSRDLLAYRSPDLNAIYPELVASADGSITAADVEKRRQTGSGAPEKKTCAFYKVYPR